MPQDASLWCFRDNNPHGMSSKPPHVKYPVKYLTLFSHLFVSPDDLLFIPILNPSRLVDGCDRSGSVDQRPLADVGRAAAEIAAGVLSPARNVQRCCC